MILNWIFVRVLAQKHRWMMTDAFSWTITLLFILGYLCITLEHIIKINKTTTALLMGIVCWALLFTKQICPTKTNLSCFLEHLAEISQIILFLLGALIIVELINIHQGFKLISDLVTANSKRNLLWAICGITFFLSAILDNLTTTIVMITFLWKLMPKSEERLIIGGGIVIAANAGGAWTPIGDVTTTMLWIGGELSSGKIIADLFIPSVICAVTALIFLTFQLNNEQTLIQRKEEKIEPHGKTILFLGMGALIFVPIFKMLTGLPPFMGMLFGLGILWVVTDLLHTREDLKVPAAMSRIDLSSVLFFLGILLAVDALDSQGLLEHMARWFDRTVGSDWAIATIIGLGSAIVDNVPLVAAAMKMYTLDRHPIDSPFWELVAFCAGTGGSVLIIGSAAGVVYMGLEKVDFFWYLRKISLAALVGYFAGIGAYFLQLAIR